MNALVRKEIRSLLPAWLAALALVVVPELLVWIAKHAQAAPPDPVLFWFFGFAVLLLSLASFGQEFSAGTFTMLLVQPIPRVRLWRIKLAVLAVALASIALLFLIGFWSRPIAIESGNESLWTYFILIWALIILCGMSGALWSTLLLRQAALAFAVTIIAPGFVCLPVAAFTKAEGHLVFNMSTALLVYAVAGFLFARQMFLRAQDVLWSGGNLPAPSLTNLFGVSVASRNSPLRALVLKEIQFQHVSLLLAPVVYVIFAAFIVVQPIWHPQKTGSMETIATVLLILGAVLWATIPFLLGSVAVAEERKLGTLESHLCLPVSRRVQFIVKFAVTVLLAVLLCAVIPFVIESAGRLIGWHDGPFTSDRPGEALAIASAIVAGIAAISFFASTLTRNTLHAMFQAVIGSLIAAGLTLWCLHPRAMYLGQSAGYGPLFGCIGGPLLIGTVLWLAFRNYGWTLVDFRRWSRNALILLAMFVFSWAATALTYHRSWELFMNLEPPHGPARLSGPVRPQIVQYGPQLFVLLPDGRLWVSKHTQDKLLFQYYQNGQFNDANVPVPLDGEVLSQKWLCIAARYDAPIGIQSDGTLWTMALNRTNMTAAPELKRVGSDSDWKSAVAGSGYYLAVKTNGTLWGWGDNRDGALGPGPADFKSPRQIGSDKDWDSVDVEYSVAIGIKRDGSVWKWGHLQFSPRGDFYSGGGRHQPEPMRWNADASDWVKRTGGPNCDLVVRRDGTMWISGSFPPEMLGMPIRYEGDTNFFQVGRESDWVDVEMWGNQLVAIRKNGTFIESDLYHRGFRLFGSAQTWHPSKHSDWIAAAPEWSELTIALAVDGTLSCWFRGPYGETETQYLGPSRKPIWNLNILAANPTGGTSSAH